MKLDKDQISALTGTLIFHGVLLLLLLIMALRTPLPLPGEQGVEVNIGYAEQGTGDVQQEQPQEVKETPPPAQPEQSQPEAEEEIVTQDTEEAPALEDVTEEKTEEDQQDDKKPEPEKQEETEQPAEETPEETEPEEPEVDPRALYPGNTETQDNGQNQGNSDQPGDEGSPFGTQDSDNFEGEGGTGNGISFSLGGRKSKHLPKPEYISEDQGKVVVTIYVDRYGNVNRANAGAKGTTVTDQRLHKVAKEAALRAKFSTDPEAPEVQKGTITYNFIRMN